MAVASTMFSLSLPSFDNDAVHVRRAAEIADASAGMSSPHPNYGCVIARGKEVVGEGYLYAEGTKCAELQAVEMARDKARGATAFLNLEPGDSYGNNKSVVSLIQAGIERVVIGLRHPLQHLRGKAINILQSQGMQVNVIGDDLQMNSIQSYEEALKSCLLVNAPLLYGTAFGVPYSVTKYAMTLDGKIACTSGHSSWISSKLSRNKVFDLRGRSDAVIVGGNTVRLDDPHLTARHGGTHVPVRMVMSRTLSLPNEANLWNVDDGYTIVLTQRGARKNFQELLRSKGVEVIEFDVLNPREVMEYCYSRGYLSVLWECGGELAASAIGAGVIHKVYAFVSPKIIGGKNAPSPVGELGMVEMSQALNLMDVSFEQIGRDMLISGFLQPIPDMIPVIPFKNDTTSIDPMVTSYDANIIFFYKTWDSYGVFSNFSPHSIHMPDKNGQDYEWSTVEHYYQSQKFIGQTDLTTVHDFVEQIKLAKSPEAAARLARMLQKKHSNLVRSDWESVKIDIMYSALKCKFSTYPHLKALLLSTAGSVLVEASPHDLFWGGGRDGEGLNYLGRLLMQLRAELLSGDLSTCET